MSRFALLLVLAAAPASFAQDVGRQFNWQDPTSPNYPEPLAAKELYQLPAIPELAGDGSAGSRMGSSPSLFVDSISVEDVSVFSVGELSRLTEPYTNRNVSIDELQALRLELSRKYVESGYINSGVVIPDQTVESGVVRMVAIEGNLTRIEFADDMRLTDGYVRKRISRYVNSPLNGKDLQEALQWIQLDRNIDRLDARLSPGAKLGESVLYLSVDEAPRFRASLSADNHNASSVGPERGRATVVLQNLSGLGELFQASTSLTEGADSTYLSVDLPVNRWNSRVQTYYSESDSKIIERQFEDLSIESKTDTTGLLFVQPITETLDRTIVVTLGVEKKHSETELLGIPFSLSPGAVNGEADTAPVLLGLDWTTRNDNRVATVRATYRKGLDWLDATIFEPANDFEAALNPTGADGDFDVLLVQGSFLYRLNQFGWFSGILPRAQLVIRGTAQLSNDPLLSLEKIAIGGANSVRGYSENLLVRDNGLSATIEMQLPIPGFQPAPSVRSLLFAPFIDYGRSWDEVDTDPVSDIRNTNDARSIVGAGVGFLWQPIQGLTAQLYWGLDVYDNFDGDDPRDSDLESDLQDDGVHFLIAYQLPF